MRERSPITKKDLVTQIKLKKITRLSVRTYVRTPLALRVREPSPVLDLGRQPWFTLQRTSLTLDIQVMVDWQLSKQGIRWPVSRDHIVGSGLKLIEVAWFLKLTAVQVLVFNWVACSSQVITLGEKEGDTYNGKISVRINPRCFVDFSSEIYTECKYGGPLGRRPEGVAWKRG